MGCAATSFRGAPSARCLGCCLRGGSLRASLRWCLLPSRPLSVLLLAGPLSHSPPASTSRKVAAPGAVHAPMGSGAG
eukprot:7862562-Alexandrium_andersonii.AAC.1